MNLWKKTLLATAVAAISTGAMAAKTTADATVDNISQEGYAVAAAGTQVEANWVTIHSGVNWSKDDLITVTLEGATFASGQTLDLVNSVAGVASFTLLSQTDRTAVFRVAQIINAGGNTAGSDFVFGLAKTATTVDAPKVNLPASVEEGYEVKMTAVVTTPAGQVIDATSKDSAVVIETESQFSVANLTAQAATDNAKLASTVPGAKFTELAGGAALTFNANYVDNSANVQVPFDVTSQKVTVTGPVAPFNDTVNTKNGTIGAAGETAKVFGTNKVTFTTPAQVATAVTLTDAHVLTDVDASTESLIAGSFASSFELKDAAGNLVKLSGQKIGSIGLDSLSAVLPYLPVGDAVSPFVWVTNHGTVAGDIHATAMTVNGTVYDLGVIGKAKPGLTKVDTAVVEALKDAGVNTQYETVRLELYIEDTTGAINDVSVYGAYKHIGDSDRLQVPVYLSSKTNNID